MPNPYFKFKQFTVWHDQCAMKVGTDGVLLGAWANPEKAKHILDVGSGSGLVSLMLAQRCSPHIDAIDIDSGAYEQSLFNFEKSPWSDRISIHHISFSDWVNEIKRPKYDLIVSNPPFFEKSLKPQKESRAKARHADNLGLKELIVLSKAVLKPDGAVALIYPANQLDAIKEVVASNEMYLTRLTNVVSKPNKLPKRVLAQLSKEEKRLEEDELVIEEFGRHEYSQDFKHLLRDYYLAF